jgi:nitroimidazol reductase NimA-like FMN-containing flavoprotein (pyridoxamine 5'-phosphate oxidase superfamily)
VIDETEKMRALEALTDHFVPDRWKDVRPPTELEMKATSVLRLPLTEASAKIRSGPPVDDDADHELDVWVGIVPISLVKGEPIQDL